MSATPCQNRLSLRATFPCKPLVCREDRQSNERGAHRPAAWRPLGSASQKQKGYTLLEIILALGLSVLVIGGITVAMNFHMVTLREQQEEIERAQIARQSLFM
ncbi:MAG: type II secretion system protein, partial [Planctomycetota bacterium]|nr:type II secretion system protein [Planctomycetota bacterium]